MDNFRKFKSPERRPGVMDGFLPGGARADAQSRRGTLRPTRPTPHARPQLGNFKGTDGFVAGTHPQLRTSAKTQTSTPKLDPLERIDMALPEQQKQKKLGRKERAGKKPKSLKRKLLRFTGIVALVALLAGGYVVGHAYFAVHGVFKGGGNAPALAQSVDPTKLNGEGDGRVNILMLGKGGEGHEGADLTDTMMVASIDPVNKKASLLSIPRDLWVANPSGGNSKINAVYATAKNAVLAKSRSAENQQKAEQAGLKAAESVVEQTMGIPMHYYVMVDFVAFEKAINTVGGIDLTIDPSAAGDIVKETLWDEMTGKNYTLNVQPGQNHFDGQRALMYSRSRHTSARGDFDRSERQRKVLVALKDKVLSAGTFGNPVKVNQLISDFGNHVQSNLSTGEVMRVYDIAKGIDSSTINSVGLADPPNNYVTTDMVSGQSIVRPRAGLTDFSEIQNYIRNTLKDGYIQNESANIAVYNGSTIAGLAGKKANELKSFGYTITTVANAPKQNYPQTILVDLTNGNKKYTKHYLEQRLGVTAVTSLPDSTISASGSDFVIILGQSESSRQ